MEYVENYLNVTRAQLLADLRQKITPKRFKHVLGVEQTAIELAQQYGVNREKASIAALMHDYAKDYADDEMLKLAQQCWQHPDLVTANDNIWHGFAAATIAKEQYQVSDEAILSAIAGHTIGWYEFSDVGKVVFVADYIEPGRRFPGVEQARLLANQSLDDAVEYKMTQTIQHLITQRQAIFVPTVEIYNQWILRRKI